MNQNTEHATIKLERPQNTAKLKQIRCPRCGSRLADVNGEIDAEVYEINPTEAWKADFSIKCWRCRVLIGIKKLNQAS